MGGTIQRAVEIAQDNTRYDGRCLLLGLPKSATVAGTSGAPGSAVEIHAASGLKQSYLLCAHVERDSWLAHKGSMTGGALDEDDPFSTRDLCAPENIPRRLPEDGAARRRIGPHTKGEQLLEAAQNHQQSWNRAVATAAKRAEEIRAARRPVEMMVASAGFQADPFKWEFAWVWWAGGRWHRQLVAARAHQSADPTRGIPLPDALQTDDRQLAAANSTVPCECLGVQLDGGAYEPDPRKWPRNRYPAGEKSHAVVWCGRKHVARGDAKKLHRVPVYANNIAKPKKDGDAPDADKSATPRSLPQNPLDSSCPRELYFSVEFMQAFAQNRHGASYACICFESDRPSLLLQVPDGGRDGRPKPFVLPPQEPLVIFLPPPARADAPRQKKKKKRACM